MVAAVYFAVNLVFAGLYVACGQGGFVGVEQSDGLPFAAHAFFFSVQTLATIGYGRISPLGWIPNLLVTIEALTGALSIALMTGLMFARFARPTAKVLFSSRAVLHVHDGVPSLLFRLANERLNQILEGQVKVVLSISEMTQEGERYRTFYDLALERSTTPIFAASWTVVHPICDTSPIKGKSLAELKDAGAEILVSFSGIDETLSQPIYSRFSYIADELAWNQAFEDILKTDGNGNLEVDLEAFHSTREVQASQRVGLAL